MNNHSELMEVATAELKQHGIKPQITYTNGGHIEIAWRVVPEKELRRVITSKTGSDWRARMNIRSEVRKLLRADNVSLKREEPKPKKHQELTKALNLPQQVVPIPDQIAARRGEVADLTELMIRVRQGCRHSARGDSGAGTASTATTRAGQLAQREDQGILEPGQMAFAFGAGS